MTGVINFITPQINFTDQHAIMTRNLRKESIMQSVTIQANDALIKQIIAVAKALADTMQESISIDKSTPNSRFSEYEDDIKAFKEGKLETYSLEKYQEITSKW